MLNPPSGALAVHPEPVTVQLPVTGWFVEGADWGVVDATGVRRSVGGGPLEVLVAASDWSLSPQLLDGRLSWIDWSGATAKIVRRPGAVVEGDADIAAFADSRGVLARLEVEGPDTLGGSYERATLRWPEGALDLGGGVAGAIAMGIDDDEVGLSTPGDGVAIRVNLSSHRAHERERSP